LLRVTYDFTTEQAKAAKVSRFLPRRLALGGEDRLHTVSRFRWANMPADRPLLSLSSACKHRSIFHAEQICQVNFLPVEETDIFDRAPQIDTSLRRAAARRVRGSRRRKISAAPVAASRKALEFGDTNWAAPRAAASQGLG
jgi:hypothetical protein